MKYYLNPNLTLSYELINQLTSSISSGLSLNDSFILLGIPKNTYTNWFKLANEELSNRDKGIYDTSRDIYLSLLYDTESSLISLQQSLLSKLIKSNDTKATMFLLERLYKDRFSITTKNESNISLTQPKSIEIIVKDETDSSRLDKLEKEVLLNI